MFRCRSHPQDTSATYASISGHQGTSGPRYGREGMLKFRNKPTRSPLSPPANHRLPSLCSDLHAPVGTRKSCGWLRRQALFPTDMLLVGKYRFLSLGPLHHKKSLSSWSSMYIVRRKVEINTSINMGMFWAVLGISNVI